MKTTGSWFCRLVRMGWLTGVALASTHFVVHADDTLRGVRASKDAADRPASTRAPLIGIHVINTMIDDAMRDGTLETNEREIILSQVKRLLGPGQVAAFEARLNKLPATATAPGLRLGAPVELAENETAPVRITKVSVKTPTELHSPRAPQSETTETTKASYAENANERLKGCCSDSCSTHLLDNMYLFAAVDAWRGPIDGDQSNNFGARIGFNAGMPLLEEHGIGAQMGMSYGAYDFHGRFDLAPETETSSIEEQLFFTAGLFRHCNLSSGCNADRISWGIVYDRMITDNTGACTAELSLGQFRGQVGYACDENNEVGLWGSINDRSDDSFSCEGAKHTTRSIDQISLYWDHNWCASAETRFYVGIAENPGEFVVGSNAQFPLNNYCALFGGFHYILPSTSGGDPGFRDEIWNVTAGIAFYPGGNAISKTVCGNCWLPLMPVADNGNFALDLGF